MMRPLAFAVVLLSGSALFAGTPQTGRCLSAPVPETLILPDGGSFPSGELRICLRMNYSPVMSLHEISVDGRVLGMYASRSSEGPHPEGVGEPESGIPQGSYLIFIRNPEHELVLHSYHRPQRTGVEHHLFSVIAPKVTSHWNTAAAVDRPDRRERKRTRRIDFAEVARRPDAVIVQVSAP